MTKADVAVVLALFAAFVSAVSVSAASVSTAAVSRD